MNKVALMGRPTRDPEIRYPADSSMAIARYTLAVDRRIKQEGQQTADFISCVAFGKSAEFAQKYFRQGMKIAVTGRIQTGSYTNREGKKVYTTDVIIEEQEFAENKRAQESTGRQQDTRSRTPPEVDEDGFMKIPEGLEDGLPFD